MLNLLFAFIVNFDNPYWNNTSNDVTLFYFNNQNAFEEASQLFQ